MFEKNVNIMGGISAVPRLREMTTGDYVRDVMTILVYAHPALVTEVGLTQVRSLPVFILNGVSVIQGRRRRSSRGDHVLNDHVINPDAIVEYT